MSGSDIKWSQELVTYLKSVTRELKFDWNAIAAKVTEHAKAEGRAESSLSFITAKSCREMFSQDYAVEKVVSAAPPVQAVTSPLAIQDTAVTPDGKGSKINKEMADMLRDYESMSLEDLVAHVNSREEQMAQRREQIFERVLSSLGAEAGSGDFSNSDFEATKQAYSDTLAARELERRRRAEHEEELKEKQRLEQERENLRNRFQPGSVDQQGEDPLGYADAIASGIRSASKYGDSGGTKAGDKKSAELEFIDSLPYDPNVVQALENYMETDDFDMMLTELEKEIEARAPGKDADEAPSELSEILQMLDAAAASNTNTASSKRPQTSGIVISPPAPSTAVPATAAASKLASGPPPPPAAAKRASAQVITTAAPTTTKPTQLTSAEARRQPSAREREYQQQSTRTARSGADGTSGVEHKDGYESDSSDGGSAAVDDDDGVGSSDSDGDWRAMRNRQKKSSERSAPAAKQSTNTTEGFWGAYGARASASAGRAAGAASTSKYAVTTTAPANTEEEVVDVRYNPSVAELAAAADVSFHSHAAGTDVDSDSDDCSAEEQDVAVAATAHAAAAASSVAAARPVSQSVRDMVEVPESSDEEESTLEEAEPGRGNKDREVSGRTATPDRTATKDGPAAAIVNVRESPAKVSWAASVAETFEAPQPNSPKVDLSLPAPPPPVVAPLPVAPPPLPLPATVISATTAPVASTGLLGAAGGARRAKGGKVGSIMNAPRPRKGTAGVGAAAAAGEEEQPAEDDTPSNVAAPTLSAEPIPSEAAVVNDESMAPVQPLTTAQQPAAEDVVASEPQPDPEQLAREAFAAEAKRALSLDSIAAPVLSPLPYAFISNKSSGAVLELPTGTLPGELSTAGCDVEHLLVADVDQAKLGALCGGLFGDAALLAVVSWLLSVAASQYIVLGLQSGRAADGTRVCRLVLEVARRGVTQAELTSACESTLLGAVLGQDVVLQGEGADRTTMLDLVRVRDSYSAPLLSDLSWFSTPLSNELQVGDALQQSSTLVQARDVAVCVVKAHALCNSALNSEISLLPELVRRCERNGLRLCGMRLVYLSALELFSYESFCSIPGYSKPFVPAAGSACAVRCDAHLMPVLCLAFYGSSGAVRDAATKGFAASSLTNTAATVLRAVLGPEDPELARKTDPFSLRALYAQDKENNLAYPVPHSVDRLLKESTFWFGGRKQDANVKTSALLALDGAQTLQVRWTLRETRESLSAASASHLSAVQTLILGVLSDTFALTGHLQSLSTEAVPRKVSSADAGSEPGGGYSTQQFACTFRTHAGLACVAHTTATLAEKVSAAPGTGGWTTVSFSWERVPFAASSSTTQQMGSRLLALEMLKRVSEDDCRSHEDVGLSDVLVVTVGNYAVLQPAGATVDEPPSAAGASANAIVLLPVLLKALSYLPKTCGAHIIAVKCNSGTSGMVAAVRGYQIVENIDHAVAELQRAYSTNNSSSAAGVSSNPAGSKRGDLEARIASTVRAYRAKKGLEILFTEFKLSAIYADLALRDLHTYVPLPGLQRSDVPWYDQVAVVSEASAAAGAAAMEAQLAPAQLLQALYPPGVFTALGVLIVPWQKDSSFMTRNLAKIFTRLEKDRFSILDIKAVSGVPEKLITALYQENRAEYSPQQSTKGQPLSDAVSETLQGIAVGSSVAVLVRRRSALLQLKSVVGPIFSAEVAEAQYPRSLVSLLHSLSAPVASSISPRSGSGAAQQVATSEAAVPFILPTLSCASAQAAMQAMFPYFHASYDAQQAAVELNHVSSDLHAAAADSANIEHVTEVAVGTGKVGDVVLQLPMVSRLNSTTATATPSTGAARELAMKEVASPSATSGAATLPVAIKNVDIAAVVITHALLKECGVGLILEALHREGLTLRNIYTTHLTSAATKQLLALAGASSLSMKPPVSLLADSPVLVLGLEGPSHSFVRLKSFSLLPRSSTLLWKLTGFSHGERITHTTGAGVVLDRDSVVGEFGAIASSSSRLARDLFRHCFDELHGADTAYEFR